MGVPPAVIFLAGSGRSGSTLVERMLGEMPSFVNVGELIDLFRRVIEGDELCGCGERFSRCEFWDAVGERAFDGWKPALVQDIAQLQAAVARQRFIPHHLSPRQGRRFRNSVVQYREAYASLYRAIAETAGVDTVVDASKLPAQAMALAGEQIDLRVVSVVRDIRGVAWSMSKRGVVRPHSTQGVEEMFNRGMYFAAAEWTLCQAEVDALRFLDVPLARIRYERLAVGAKAEVRGALKSLGFDMQEADLAHLRAGEADLGMSHGLSGNPSRFHGGTTKLRTDEVWRDQMPRPRQVLIAGIGLPHRFRTPSSTGKVERFNEVRSS